MLRAATAKGGGDAEAFMRDFVSLGRLLSADEIARTIVFAVGVCVCVCMCVYVWVCVCV